MTSSNNTYAYIETLLSYGTTAKKSQLTSQLYYKDVAGALEEINPYDDNPVNTGFVARSQFTNVSGVLDMIGKIHSDLSFQDKYILNIYSFIQPHLVRQISLNNNNNKSFNQIE